MVGSPAREIVIAITIKLHMSIIIIIVMVQNWVEFEGPNGMQCSIAPASM